MCDIIDKSFKEQINLFYFAHMPRVAHDLFAQGLKISTVASNLLITKEKAQRLRELYEKGELTETSVESKFSDLNLPFVDISNQYHWEEFAYETKCAAKVFFDMWLSVRATASYLRVPMDTVYAWRRLYKQNKFKIDAPIDKLPSLKLSEEKFTTINNHKYYSFEIRKAAKDCFEKKMKISDIVRFLDIPKETIFSWKRDFEIGRFYVSEKEKSILNKLRPNPPKALPLIIQDKPKIERIVRGESGERWIYNKETRRAAKKCFEHGLGYKATAKYLGIPQSAVREWNRLYKEGRFIINNQKNEKESIGLTV